MSTVIPHGFSTPSTHVSKDDLIYIDDVLRYKEELKDIYLKMLDTVEEVHEIIEYGEERQLAYKLGWLTPCDHEYKEDTMYSHYTFKEGYCTKCKNYIRYK